MIPQLSWNARARLKPFLIQKAVTSLAAGRRDWGFVLCSRARFIVSLCFSVLITGACVFAQSSAEPGQMATNSATGVPDADRRDDTDAQVLRELEQMRTRIQELEARLKQRSGAQKSATEAGASRPPMQDDFTAAPVPASVAASAQTQIESSNTQAKAPKAEPFAFADWTWLNGNARTKESPLDTKFFTPEIRADVDYIYDFNHPKDDTISGSSEVFRSNEIRHGIGVRARSRHLTCGG
jgi:hypothetical protein